MNYYSYSSSSAVFAVDFNNENSVAVHYGLDVDGKLTHVFGLLCGCLVSPAAVFSLSCSLVNCPPGGSGCMLCLSPLWFPVRAWCCES